MPPARLLLTSAFGLALAAQGPAEVTSTARDRTALGITLYRNDLAMVRDTRRIALPAGASRLAFADVAASIRPKSAWMAFPAGVTVRERNYEFDLLSPWNLLKHALQQPVGLGPGTDPFSLWGTLQSLPEIMQPKRPERGVSSEKPLHRIARRHRILPNSTSVILKTTEGEYTIAEGPMTHRNLPPALRSSPTLLAELSVPGRLDTEATLAYTAEGFTWQATYRARLSPSGRTMDLEGFVTLTNRSGTDFPATTLQLVAGEPNQVYDPAPRDEDVPSSDGAIRVAVVSPEPSFEEETLSDYLLLTLDRPTSVRNGQTKQVRLFEARGIPLRRTFLFTWTPCLEWFQHPAARRGVPGPWIPGSEWIRDWAMRRLGLDPRDPRDWERRPSLNLTYPEQVPQMEPQREAPKVILEFTNTAASNLARPLPRGAFWMSTRTPEGLEVPLGWTSLEDTPVGAEALLESPGDWAATGVRATHRWRPVAWDPEGLDLEGESFLENARNEPAPILLRLQLPPGTTLRPPTRAHSAGPGSFDFELTLPPRGKKALRFRARVPRAVLPFSDEPSPR